MEGNTEQKEVRKVSIELTEQEIQSLLGIIDSFQSKLSIFNEEHLKQKRVAEFVGHKIFNQASAQLPNEETEETNG